MTVPHSDNTRTGDTGRARIRPLRDGVAVAAILLLTACLSIALLYGEARRAYTTEVRDDLVRKAQAAAALIDGDLHRTFTDPAQEDSEDYRRAVAPLRRVLQGVNGLRFLYTVVLVDGKVHFVLDATPPGDADHDGVEDHSAIMERYDAPDPAMWAALREGHPTATGKPYVDRWGALLSGYAPFFDSAGQQVGVVGVDITAAEYGLRLAALWRAAWWGLLPAVGVSLLAGLGVHHLRRNALRAEGVRRRSEAALHASEERYRSIVDDQTELICRFLPGGTVTFANQAYCRAFGHGRKEFIGQNILTTVSPEGRRAIERHMGTFTPAQSVHTYDYPVCGPDGSKAWYHWTVRAFFDEHGQCVELQSAGRDITQRKQSEDARNLEREQLLSILDNTDEPVYVSDPDTYELLYFNEAARRQWGDGVGQKCYQVLQGLDAPCAFCTNDRIFGENAGRPHTWEFQNALNRRWYRCIDKAIRWPDGRLVRYEMAIDITQRKEATEQLQLTQFWIDRAMDPTYWLDTTGRVIYVNEAVCQCLGYTRDELLSMNVRDFDPDLTPTESAQKAQELQERGSMQLERRHRRKDGTFVPVEITANHLEFGGKVYAFVFARDISERKRAERELRAHGLALRVANMELEAQKQQLQAQQIELEAINQELDAARLAAEAASQTKSAFLANMSHEIRTPMTAIIGFAENLLDAGLPESERIEAARTIRRNGRHLLDILNDILDLSKIEAGRLDLERRRCSPVEIIADVCALMQVRAAEKGLRLEVEYRGLVPETIETDPTRLQQILLNLVGNALKFTEQGEVRIVAALVTPPDVPRPTLQMDVIDTGVGLSPEQIARLFRPFAQADSSTSRKFGGTGLGLVICQRLARLLGGDVKVIESKPGAGTRFRATIAAGPLEGVPLQDGDHRAAAAGCGAAEDGRPGAGRLPYRILLAEDGPDNQRLISFILHKAGAEVVTVANGQLAVNAALAAREAERPFDVILMDIQMPVMDGYDAVALLRSKNYTGAIIALTAHAMAQDRERCLQAGCDDYASKPIDRNVLIGTIRRCTEQRGVRTAAARTTRAHVELPHG